MEYDLYSGMTASRKSIFTNEHTVPGMVPVLSVFVLY